MYDYRDSSLVDFIITNHFKSIMTAAHSATNMCNSLLALQYQQMFIKTIANYYVL